MYKAFKTHNGMKVRLNPDYCLSYLEEDDVLSWFTSIEAFDTFKGFLSLIGAMILMFTDVGPIDAGIVILVLYVIGYIVSQSFSLMVLFNLIYGLIFITYEKLMRLFIPYIALIVVMFITKQYMIFAAYIVARIIAYILTNIFDQRRAKLLNSKYGIYIAQVEMTAIKSLKLYSREQFVVKKWIQEYSKSSKENFRNISN